MNTASVTANITLAVVLIFVSMIFYKESITLKQVAGIVLCSGGLLKFEFAGTVINRTKKLSTYCAYNVKNYKFCINLL